jgi:Zn-dependent M28 family amino/carboxypeptidase
LTLAAALPLALGAGLIAAPATTAAQVQAPAIDTLAIRAHASALAHDSLQGRGTGTDGERRAAAYITGQLERLGLTGAAADGGFLQPIPLRRVVVDTATTRLLAQPTARPGDNLSGTAAPGSTEFRADADFIFAPARADAFRDFTGGVLFAGTAGLAERALAATGTLEGRVIVVLGTLGNSALTLIPDWARRGAAGVVLLIPEQGRFRALAQAYGPDRLALDAAVDNPVWQPELPVLIAGPEVARLLLADAPLATDALDGRRPFHALPLAHRLTATVRTEQQALPSANIAALIPGRDPVLRDEVVVYTAHYDHLGIGTPDARGDSIYNGFSDNAAGTAMLLAIAQALRDDPPSRSSLFLFFTGEERGLLGSSYYVSAPLVPLERVVAVINLDAGAPAAPPRTWKLAGGKTSTLGTLATETAARHGSKTTLTDASPNSDHWPFLHAGVPAIFIIPGQDWEGVTRAEKEALQHRWEHYHQPADEWHPDFPLKGLQRYAEVALRIGIAAAEAANREHGVVPGLLK